VPLKLPSSPQVAPFLIVKVQEPGHDNKRSGYKSIHKLNLERKAALEEYCNSLTTQHKDSGLTLLVDDDQDSSTSSIVLEEESQNNDYSPTKNHSLPFS
jgi:hypothetical protein